MTPYDCNGEPIDFDDERYGDHHDCFGHELGDPGPPRGWFSHPLLEAHEVSGPGGDPSFHRFEGMSVDAAWRVEQAFYPWCDHLNLDEVYPTLKAVQTLGFLLGGGVTIEGYWIDDNRPDSRLTITGVRWRTELGDIEALGLVRDALLCTAVPAPVVVERLRDGTFSIWWND